VVKDFGGRSPGEFLSAVGRAFRIGHGEGAEPKGKGDIRMYFSGGWHRLEPIAAVDPRDPIGSLDVSVLQDRLLAPCLGIADPRTDTRIDFVGGIRGTPELSARVDSGRAVVAFSMFPTTVAELMAIADAGAIMPPKSTWFEPKLRSGLFVHRF